MSSLMRKSSSVVIRCFQRVEACADWATGAAGPLFVGLCWILITSGGVAFCTSTGVSSIPPVSMICSADYLAYYALLSIVDVVVRDLTPIGLLFISPLLLFVPINMYGQYYLVTHVPPGFPAPRAGGEDKDIRWLVHSPSSLWTAEKWGYQRKNARALTGNGGVGVGSNWGMAETARRVKRCRKCDGPKPERTHHCSVCKRCILLMDHHCPWINGCVGLHNQRHFVLFMAWLSVGCWSVCALGYKQFLDTFDYRAEWPPFTPRLAYTLIYVLCIAIGFAVPILASWHMYMVSKGETSIESHDNTYLEGRARAEGLIYLNPYDLGRRRNLEIFFNLGSLGYSPKTLLFPFLIPPQSNGWAYPRRQLPSASSSTKASADLHVPELADGLISATATTYGSHAEDGQGGYVMGDDGSLTDDEEGGGGYMD